MMEYNTGRSKMVISEYGRNVHKLVNLAMTIEDRQLRTSFTKVIVNIMGQMNPQLREAGDFKHKLWDHLHYIADFKLDVDAPYPKPEQRFQDTKPEHVEYSTNRIRYKTYGGNIAKIIKKASDFDEGPEKDALVHAIANHLKKSYLNWNRESVDDEQIFLHLKSLSDGKLVLKDELKLSSTNEILARNKKSKPDTKTSSKPPYKKKFKRYTK